MRNPLGLSLILLVLALSAYAAPLPFTPAVESALTPLYKTASGSFLNLALEQEWAFTFNPSGMPTPIRSSRTGHRNSLQVIPGYTQGIVHTHPLYSDPRPSDADIQIAKKYKIPNYVLSQHALWVAYPTGKIAKLATVAYEGGQLIFTPVE